MVWGVVSDVCVQCLILSNLLTMILIPDCEAQFLGWAMESVSGIVSEISYAFGEHPTTNCGFSSVVRIIPAPSAAYIYLNPTIMMTVLLFPRKRDTFRTYINYFNHNF